MPKKTETTAPEATTPGPRADTKFATLIALLKRPEGATIAQLSVATGWKPSSIRGVMSDALKKRFGLTITSQKPEGQRVYKAKSHK